MPMTHRHRFARMAGPALVLTTAGLLSVPALAPAQAATAPTAVQILKSIGQEPHAKVTRVHAEGPAVVVTDGFCTELSSAGCQLAEHTKDATLVRFDTAKNAKQYAGNAVICVVNLDPHHAQEGSATIPAHLGLPPAFGVTDQLSGERFDWRIGPNYVRLDPWTRQAHILRVES